MGIENERGSSAFLSLILTPNVICYFCLFMLWSNKTHYILDRLWNWHATTQRTAWMHSCFVLSLYVSNDDKLIAACNSKYKNAHCTGHATKWIYCSKGKQKRKNCVIFVAKLAIELWIRNSKKKKLKQQVCKLLIIQGLCGTFDDADERTYFVNEKKFIVISTLKINYNAINTQFWPLSMKRVFWSYATTKIA